jgi:hypothetical protein
MKLIRYVLLAGGLFTLVLAFGFIFQMPFALRIWPWPDGRLSYLFIGSIFAAISAATLWIGWTGDLGALPAGSLNLVVIEITSAIYFTMLVLRDGRAELLPFMIGAWILAVVSGGFFLWSRTLDMHDSRPTPGFIRVSFGIFLAALIFSGTALILRSPVFPWKLNPDSSVIFGCIFLGDAFYFLYALLVPRLSNAIGQLLSFLAYDLVLIVPFLKLLTTVDPALRINLIVYVIVLLFSAGLAVYYLFIHPQTRNWLSKSAQVD